MSSRGIGSGRARDGIAARSAAGVRATVYAPRDTIARVTLAVDLVFIAQVLALAGILVWRRPRVGVGLAIWLGVLAVLAGQGYFLKFDGTPPRLTFAGLLPLAVGLVMLPTHGTRHFLAVTPPERLIYLQSFRILMEIILWALAVQGRAPKLMTFEGRNFDILIGLTAIPVAWMVVERRKWPTWVAAAWNAAGIVILANVVIHAQLALPTPFRAFVTEPPPTFLASFPYIWLVGFLVPFALWLHAGSLVQLSRRPAR